MKYNIGLSYAFNIRAYITEVYIGQSFIELHVEESLRNNTPAGHTYTT